MEKSLVRWAKIALVLEVLLGSIIGLLVVFDAMTAEAAQAAIIKVTLGIVVLAVAGAVIGGILAKPDAGSQKP